MIYIVKVKDGLNISRPLVDCISLKANLCSRVGTVQTAFNINNKIVKNNTNKSMHFIH